MRGLFRPLAPTVLQMLYHLRCSDAQAHALTPVMAHRRQISDFRGLGKLRLPSTERKTLPVGFLPGKIPIASSGKVVAAGGAQRCPAGALAAPPAKHRAPVEMRGGEARGKTCSTKRAQVLAD